MKNLLKYILTFALLAVFSASYSQSTVSNMLSASNGTAIDTVTDAGTKSQVLQISGFRDVVTIVSTVTEISGTTAGAVNLYGSVDGTNYALITGTFSPADQAAAQSHYWSVDPSKFAYYKVVYVGAGTMAAKISSKALVRKR